MLSTLDHQSGHADGVKAVVRTPEAVAEAHGTDGALDGTAGGGRVRDVGKVRSEVTVADSLPAHYKRDK